MNVAEHYEKRRQIDLLEGEDERRKHLIQLAIMRVAAITRAPSPVATLNENVEKLSQKCLNYELTINKLKQEWNTKEKLNEAKIDKLKEEVTKLKQRGKPTGALVLKGTSVGSGFQRTSLSYATSPYLSRAVGSKNFLSPTLNSLNKTTVKNPMLVSPIGNRRGKYITAKTIKNAIQKPVQNPMLTPKPKLKSTNTEWNLSMTMNKSPTRMSFVENFDLSDSNEDALGVFNEKESTPTSDSPTKMKSQVSVSPNGVEKEGPDANSTAIIDETVISAGSDKSGFTTDDEESFASANSTLNNTNERPKRKQIKRLNLAGSLIESGKRAVSRGLSVEQDGINTLDYYKDTNFTEGNEESPNFKRTVSGEFEKKKRRVFKIN